MIDTESYLDLITHEYNTKPKFIEYCKTFLDFAQPSADLIYEFDELFNLNTAVGDQLDKLGAIMNVSRELPVTLQDVPSSLTDELYRTVIKVKIASCFWDGTNSGYLSLLNLIFPGTGAIITDNQDMSMSVVIIDPSASPAYISLLSNGYLLPKPSGVRVNYTVSTDPMFGWDTDSNVIKGWDSGKWI